jgi:hypothetical protein
MIVLFPARGKIAVLYRRQVRSYFPWTGVFLCAIRTLEALGWGQGRRPNPPSPGKKRRFGRREGKPQAAVGVRVGEKRMFTLFET